MKQIKDLLIERLILNKQAHKSKYFFHKEKSVKFVDTSKIMSLYYISSSEDETDSKSFLGFVIISPYDLEYEDKLGRITYCKAMGAIRYADLENNIDTEIIQEMFNENMIDDKDDCIIGYPGEICNSLSMQLPRIIAQSLINVLSELWNNINFFKDGFFEKQYLKADWYTRG